MDNKKVWICNPYKNKDCKKMICGIMDDRDISNPHRCFLTTNKKFRLEPSDPDKIEYVNRKERIEKWIKEYYGKEDEVDGWRLDTN